VVLEEVEVGPEVAGDMRSTVGCVWRRRQLLRCSWHCSPDALRTATASGSQSRAQLHSPSACSPQLLIDGYAVNTALCCVKSREAEGFVWRSVARRGKQKRLWPQRREDRGVLRRWLHGLRVEAGRGRWCMSKRQLARSVHSAHGRL
jgi:hypothetical protein